MINGRKLNENISPNQRRLRLKELSGQKLTNKEKETYWAGVWSNSLFIN